MEKKYQVFISSTYSDLKEERKSIQETLLSLDCIPAGMENFVAEDKSQLEVIKKIIDLCDYYILIIGGRYGSIEPKTQKSYTELEYDYAVSKNIPILVFAVDEKKLLKKDRSETDDEKKEKLELFRNKALSNKLGGIWENKKKLIQLVSTSISKAINTVERPGWVRGAERNVRNSSNKELVVKIKELQDENQKLKQMSGSNQKIVFETCKICIKYRIIYYYKNTPIERSRIKRKRTTLGEVYKFLSLSISGYKVEKSHIEQTLKDFIKPHSKIQFEDIQIIDKLINQYKELGLFEQVVESGIYKYSLTNKGEKTKNKLNTMM